MHICNSKLTIIGSDNGLSPGQHQVIIWTSARILLIAPFTNKLQWNLNQNTKLFINENALENVVRKMAAILSQPRCVNSPCLPHGGISIQYLIASFMGPTWGPSRADRNQVGNMLAPWTLLSGVPALCQFWEMTGNTNKFPCFPPPKKKKNIGTRVEQIVGCVRWSIFFFFYFFKMDFYFLILFPAAVIFLYITGPIHMIFTQHCTRPSVSRKLSMHPCVSCCLWVNRTRKVPHRPLDLIALIRRLIKKNKGLLTSQSLTQIVFI